MPTYNDGYQSFTVSKLTEQRQKVVRLANHQFQRAYLSELALFLPASEHYLAGEITSQSDDQVEITYTIPKEAVSLKRYLKSLTKTAVFELMPQLYWLTETKADGQQPLIHPNNLYVIGNQIVAMHRGLKQAIAPEVASEDQLVNQLRALVLWMVDPSLDYAEMVTGVSALDNTLAELLANATTLPDLKQSLNEQIYTQVQISHQTEITIKKKQYQFMKYGNWVAGSLAVILFGLTLVWGLHTIPKQKAIIAAQNDFQVADYDGTTQKLKRYRPQSLPQGARYALAVAYVNQDSLSKDQKAVVLKHLSPSSSKLQLNYWIMIGRGNYKQALSIAKNIGDNEYILHAYAKLYTETKNDTTMDGGKKQKQLNAYRKQINQYIHKLGGAKNEFEGN